MEASARQPFRRRAAVRVALAAVALALLVSAPLGALATSSPSRVTTIAATPASGPITATVTWDGVNIATANTTSSAFHISFNGAVNLLYSWSQPVLTAAAWSVNDARLQIFYFGFALGTRDITTTVGRTTGSIVMGNWSTGPLQYILEGTYMLTASLIATNGSTAWSQSFWVDVAAPFYILAVLPLVLVLIAIYEVYALCCSGQHYSRPKVAQSTTPPATPPSAATPPTTPATTAPEPAAESTPPPGGSS